jgi:hypothetical protein
MKRLAPCILGLILASPVFASLHDFEGFWYNPDARLSDLVTIVVRTEGSHVSVHVWQHCDSGTCDWGQVNGIAYALSASANLADSAHVVSAVFRRPDGEVLLILRVEDRLLKVDALTHFKGQGPGPPEAQQAPKPYAVAYTFRYTPTATASKPPPPPPPTSATPPSAADGHPREKIPQFPWPPPRASAMALVPRSFLTAPTGMGGQLADVSGRLLAALDLCGYSEHSFYAVPDGFALVTQLEQINPDGTPKQAPARWAADVPPLRSFSMSDYLKALFTANPGYYRIIVFVVTSHPFSQAEAAVGREEAERWLASGLNQLPDTIGKLPFSEAVACTALIYEFEQREAGKEPVILIPSDLTGTDHLAKSRLWDVLKR